MLIEFLPCQQSRSAWVECLAPSVCLFVCPQHNSKTNDPRVFKLGVENVLRYPRNNMVLGLKGRRLWSQGTFFTLIIGA